MRTTGDPAALAPQLRQIIREANPAIPVMGVTTLDAIAARSLVQERLMANLASAFGVLALIVAAAGVAGVLLFAVTRRTQEIGIRMALGATRGNVVRMVLREAGILVAAGLALGVPGAILLGRVARTLLFGLTPADPLVLGAASALLVLAAFAATAWPARRAAKVDPMIALRAE